MWGCMRYLSLESVLPLLDDCQLSPCEAALTGKQSTVIVNAIDSEMYFNPPIKGTLRKYISV